MTDRSSIALRPREDMLAAWSQDGVLLLQSCEDCRVPMFYPRSRCPACWSPRLQSFVSSGTGTVLTHTRVHRGLSKELMTQAPITLAEIALDDGVAMIARILTSVPIATGARVRLARPAFELELPTFEPV